MKKSLKGKYHLLLLIFYLIFLLQALLILLSVNKQLDYNILRVDIQSILILFTMIQFVYFIVMYYYVPYQYERAFREMYQVIAEISEGKYQIDLDVKTYHQTREIQDLMRAMQKMMNIMSRFDSLKSDKIYEHHQRILQLLNMLPEGIIILTVIGEIVYMNTFIKAHFPALTENMNILETLLPESLEAELKPIIIDSIHSDNNIHDVPFTVSTTMSTYSISSSMVRNRKGQSTGAIFVILPA